MSGATAVAVGCWGLPHLPQPAVGGQPGVPVYNMAGVGGGSPGGGVGGVRTSPAAIQQGGVDGKQLGRPGNFNPADSKVSFLDWADSIMAARGVPCPLPAAPDAVPAAY